MGTMIGKIKGKLWGPHQIRDGGGAVFAPFIVIFSWLLTSWGVCRGPLAATEA